MPPKSLSYYFILIFLRLFRLKKVFTQLPFNYLHLRKNDIHEPIIKNSEHLFAESFELGNTKINSLSAKQKSGRLLIFLHGGAFVSGPSAMHWQAAEKLAMDSGFTVWLCDYPKAPEHQIQEISENLDAVYQLALQQYNSEHIVFMGDSAGGTLALALTMRCIKNKIRIPAKLILISPVLDASFENPEIDLAEKKDLILSKAGLIAAAKMCAGNWEVKNEQLSPLHGTFKGFPPVNLFLAENDITYPDQKLLCQKLEADEVKFQVFLGDKMPHVWPLIPYLKESATAFREIIKILAKL